MAIAPDASLLATKRIVYVGGLGEEIKEDLIRAAFIPFGTIKSVMMVRSKNMKLVLGCCDST